MQYRKPILQDVENAGIQAVAIWHRRPMEARHNWMNWGDNRKHTRSFVRKSEAFLREQIQEEIIGA